MAVRDGAAGTLSASTVRGDIGGVVVCEGDSQALVARSTIRVAGFGINVGSFGGGTSNAVTVLNSLVVANPTGNTRGGRCGRVRRGRHLHGARLDVRCAGARPGGRDPARVHSAARRTP